MKGFFFSFFFLKKKSDKESCIMVIQPISYMQLNDRMHANLPLQKQGLFRNFKSF